MGKSIRHKWVNFFSAQQGVLVMMNLFSYVAVITPTASTGYITSVQAVVAIQVNAVIADIIPTEDDER